MPTQKTISKLYLASDEIRTTASIARSWHRNLGDFLPVTSVVQKS
jgi:hypothetical protein